MSAMPVVEGFLDLKPYVFVSECLHVSIRGTSFYLLFFKTFQTFPLGVRFRS